MAKPAHRDERMTLRDLTQFAGPGASREFERRWRTLWAEREHPFDVQTFAARLAEESALAMLEASELERLIRLRDLDAIEHYWTHVAPITFIVLERLINERASREATSQRGRDGATARASRFDAAREWAIAKWKVEGAGYKSKADFARIVAPQLKRWPWLPESQRPRSEGTAIEPRTIVRWLRGV